MRSTVVALVVAGAVLASCGDGGQQHVTTVRTPPRAAPAAHADPSVAAQSINAFGADLFTAVTAHEDGNVIVSPVSVVVALAMLEPGASGEAHEQLLRALHIDDPVTFHAAMSALEQDLEGRVAQANNPGEDPGEVVVRIANAAYLQQGYGFERAYLDTIGHAYGPVLQEVDFEKDPDAVAHAINHFVDAATAHRIPHIVADGALRRETVLALVNALYLKASWLQVFDKKATADGHFTHLDGTRETVPLMHGGSDASARGDGWVAATKSYVGGLAVQFILPDEGRFDEVSAHPDAAIAGFEQHRTAGSTLAVPRFEARFSAELGIAFRALGLGALYEERGLLGIAHDPTLVLDKALHESFVAMDETGTEAAAATVLTGAATSGPLSPPVPVVLDRPFLFRIFDQASGATLFLGRILDPSALR